VFGSRSGGNRAPTVWLGKIPYDDSLFVAALRWYWINYHEKAAGIRHVDRGHAPVCSRNRLDNVNHLIPYDSGSRVFVFKAIWLAIRGKSAAMLSNCDTRCVISSVQVCEVPVTEGLGIGCHLGCFGICTLLLSDNFGSRSPRPASAPGHFRKLSLAILRNKTPPSPI
jgi:hypothetical protein